MRTFVLAALVALAVLGTAGFAAKVGEEISILGNTWTDIGDWKVNAYLLGINYNNIRVVGLDICRANAGCKYNETFFSPYPSSKSVSIQRPGTTSSSVYSIDVKLNASAWWDSGSAAKYPALIMLSNERRTCGSPGSYSRLGDKTEIKAFNTAKIIGWVVTVDGISNDGAADSIMCRGSETKQLKISPGQTYSGTIGNKNYRLEDLRALPANNYSMAFKLYEEIFLPLKQNKIVEGWTIKVTSVSTAGDAVKIEACKTGTCKTYELAGGGGTTMTLAGYSLEIKVTKIITGAGAGAWVAYGSEKHVKPPKSKEKEVDLEAVSVTAPDRIKPGDTVELKIKINEKLGKDKKSATVPAYSVKAEYRLSKSNPTGGFSWLLGKLVQPLFYPTGRQVSGDWVEIGTTDVNEHTLQEKTKKLELKFSWVPDKAGKFDVRAVADWTDAVNEIDEKNNEKVKPVDVKEEKKRGG